jgi:cytochrome oxidase assembly protein ShyY1
VLRTALQPRWLALLGAVVVVAVAFGWLGSWQLGVARDRGAEKARREVAARPPVALPQVLQPQQPFATAADGRQVVARGRYDPQRQVLIAHRLQGGTDGWWVVGALRTDAGGWLPAVRGWVPSPDDPRAAPGTTPTGPVEVHGVLQPDDAPVEDAAPLPDGQLAALDAADLVNRWGSPIYNGFLVVTQEAPASGATLSAVQPERVPPPKPQPGGLAWRNAAYAVQWWVFAGFAFVLWWKMVRQDQLDRRAGQREKVSV